jgi:DNA-binding beta-propeller fold protein YncE
MARSSLSVHAPWPDREARAVPVAFGLALLALLAGGCGKKEAPASRPGAAKTEPGTTDASATSKAAEAARMSDVHQAALKKVMEAPPGKVRVLAVAAGGNQPLNGPMGLAVDDAGNLYVADTGNARIVRYDKDGKYLGSFGGPGDGDGKFKAPVALAFGPGGNLVVLDRGTGFVQAFSKSGTFVARVVAGGPGFYNPAGLAGSAAAVFVADTGTGRLLRFPSGSPQGEELAHQGSGPGDLREPTDVFSDAEGLLVVDDQKKSILRFSPDGKFQSSFDAPAAGLIRSVRMSDGSVLVGIDQLPRYDRTGKVVARYGQFGKEPGQLIGPTSLALDKAGNLWVADTTNRVQKLALE